MARTRKILGASGEGLAAEKLEESGCRILARNVRSPFGEIDIVAQDRRTLCFIEVKTRRHDRCGDGFEAVSRTKRRRLVKAASWFMMREQVGDVALRFDVLAVDPAADGQWRVEWLQDAFQIEE